MVENPPNTFDSVVFAVVPQLPNDGFDVLAPKVKAILDSTV